MNHWKYRDSDCRWDDEELLGEGSSEAFNSEEDKTHDESQSKDSSPLDNPRIFTAATDTEKLTRLS